MARYFAVETKCGHVGKDKCIYVWFAVKAENGKIAAAKARQYKRVKHHHKDAIRKVKEISLKEYIQLRTENTNEPYLHCKNIQQQRKLDNLEERIEADEYLISQKNMATLKKDRSFLLKRNSILVQDALRQIRESYYDNNIAV